MTDKTQNFWDDGEKGWGNWSELLSRAKKSGSKLARSGANIAKSGTKLARTGADIARSSGAKIAQSGSKLARQAKTSVTSARKIQVKKVGTRARSVTVSKTPRRNFSTPQTPRHTTPNPKSTRTVSARIPQPKLTRAATTSTAQNLRRRHTYKTTQRATAKAARAGQRSYQNLNNLNKSNKAQREKLTQQNLENLKNLASATAVKSLAAFKTGQSEAPSAMARPWEGLAPATTGTKLRRSRWLRAAVLAAVAIIGVRLFWIQIIEHNAWVAKAEEQHTMQNTIVAERGEIYMMDGEEPTEVVMNEAVWTVIVDPMLADEEKTATTITPIAKDNLIADWPAVFADKTRRYYVVARGLSRQQAEAVEQAELTGVVLQKGTARVYPEGELAAAVLGFVNAEGEGQYGVEGNLNDELKGENGLLKTVKDVNNVALSIGDDNIRVPAVDGKDIVLTIDRNVQRATEKILAERLEASGATHASAVIMNPKNGKIWAMANLPGYNPTNYTSVEDATLFQNNALEDAFEPASVCKTFAFSAAIEEGVMTPDTTYYNAGFTQVDEWTINNAYKGMLGQITMQTALNYSLNTGSTQALRLLGGSNTTITQAGKDKLYDYYYNRFGFGQYTGIELYESPGIIVGSREVDGTDARYANMTFGQGLNITMAQVVAAFASVVNGGYYYTPTLVEGEMVDGELKSAPAAEPVRQALSPTTSATMRQMLYGTRNSRRLNGTDRAGYFIGGKTGTSQAIRNGAYVMDETLATYVGFGGAGDGSQIPDYVIMVKIWEPGKKIEGEKDALPIFDLLSNYMIDYLQVEPK